MASKFRQDMPPPGGYGPVQWSKVIGRRKWGGFKTWAVIGVMSAFGTACTMYNWRKKWELDLEMMEGTMAMEPLILAERHRIQLRQFRENRDEENELMKDVPGWETGTLWGEPVYHKLAGQFPQIHHMDYFTHIPEKDMNKRLYFYQNIL